MTNPNTYHRKGLSIDILNTVTLKSNKQIKINFDRGDLSSDAGLLLIKEFAAKIGFTSLIKKKFKTNDKSIRFHKDDENLLQMIYQIIRFYCGRGKMENFIKEGKNGFDFAAVSSRSKVVKANRMRIHTLAYNLFNWYRRLVLPANIRKQQVDTIRLKLIKIAARAVRSARYITFKLCSSCPYKKKFYNILKNIQCLTVQLE